LLREELEGCLHLGMEREALRLAGRILRSHNINATNFDSAVNALLICEARLGRWLGRVESAFAALSRRDQRKSAKAMFNLYVSLNRWTDAARFLPRRPATAEELLFSMWTLLNLRRIEEAEPIYKASVRRFKRVEDEFEQSCLLEAMGCYWAQSWPWLKRKPGRRAAEGREGVTPVVTGLRIPLRCLPTSPTPRPPGSAPRLRRRPCHFHAAPARRARAARKT